MEEGSWRGATLQEQDRFVDVVELLLLVRALVYHDCGAVLIEFQFVNRRDRNWSRLGVEHVAVERVFPALFHLSDYSWFVVVAGLPSVWVT